MFSRTQMKLGALAIKNSRVPRINTLTDLFNLFTEHPTLIFFDKEFVNFKDFISLEYILELCFLDDFLFPDSEDYPLTSAVDGKF